MYICEHCQIAFDNPVIRHHYERDGEELDPPTIHCPECNNDDIEEAKRCCICRDYRPAYEMDGDVCDDCLDKLKEKIHDNIFRDLTDTEISVAKEKIDIGGLV